MISIKDKIIHDVAVKGYAFASFEQIGITEPNLNQIKEFSDWLYQHDLRYARLLLPSNFLYVFTMTDEELAQAVKRRFAWVMDKCQEGQEKFRREH